jgi:hypothetical protein
MCILFSFNLDVFINIKWQEISCSFYFNGKK